MTTQPAALHYAKVLEDFYLGIGRMDATGAAAELRRLHEVNSSLNRQVASLSQNALDDYKLIQELLISLKELLTMPEADGTFSMGKLRKTIKDQARAAITKATNQESTTNVLA